MVVYNEVYIVVFVLYLISPYELISTRLSRHLVEEQARFVFNKSATGGQMSRRFVKKTPEELVAEARAARKKLPPPPKLPKSKPPVPAHCFFSIVPFPGMTEEETWAKLASEEAA